VVKSIQINKVSLKDRLVVDAEVRMMNPQDFDFSPRARIEENSLFLTNEGEPTNDSSVDLNPDQMIVAERDRMIELRVKFSVEGMHGVLTNKTKNVRDGPNSKKLAEPRWKTLLPLGIKS